MTSNSCSAASYSVRDALAALRDFVAAAAAAGDAFDEQLAARGVAAVERFIEEPALLDKVTGGAVQALCAPIARQWLLCAANGTLKSILKYFNGIEINFMLKCGVFFTLN